MANNQLLNKIILKLKELAESSLIAEAVDELMSLYDSVPLFQAISQYIVDPSIERPEWIICIRILCRIDKIKANRIFLKILNLEEDVDKRGRLIQHLSGCGTSIVVPSLLEIVSQDPDADIRFLAVIALGNIGDVRAIPVLKEAVKDSGVNYEGQTIASQAEISLGELEKLVK